MNFEQYKIAFSEKALSNGYSFENLSKCLSYAERLINHNLPIVYDVSHLSGLVGYNSNYIERAIIFTNKFYRKFWIPKSNNQFRRIAEPLPSLKDIQLWILKNILYRIEVSRFAKAYIPGMTLKQNLVFHKGQPIVLTIDIRNFFSSISKERVKSFFRHVGYSSSVSDLLSKLCTLNDRLPQGAPTSPYISNLIMIEFDDVISNYCLEANIRYTRYADDMTFSGHFNVNKIISTVKRELEKEGLRINEGKVRVMPSGVKQLVTGIIVNQKLQVPANERKKIRQSIYYINKFGLKSHLNRIKCQKSNYVEHLLGKVLFVLFINPDDNEFQNYKNFLTDLKSSQIHDE